MECLNVRGSCVVSSRSGCQTVNVRPCADQEMMWSLLGSLTRFHVFLRGVDGRRQRTAWVDAGRGGVIFGGTGEISPGVGAPRNFLTCPTARASSHRPGRAYRSRFGASRGGTSRCVTSRGHTREISRGHRTLAGAARVPRRHPSEIHVSEQEKTRNERGRRRDRETYHRNGDTFTVANGVVAPVALPGCALAPLAEVMSARVTFSSGLSPLTSHASNSQNEGYRTRMTNAPPTNSHSRESRTRITLS